jgi:hypothetical protein
MIALPRKQQLLDCVYAYENNNKNEAKKKIGQKRHSRTSVYKCGVRIKLINEFVCDVLGVSKLQWPLSTFVSKSSAASF